MADPPRPRAVRRADTLARLAGSVVDAWVATAAADEPYLVPLTLVWHDDRLVLATNESAPTARNLVGSRRARIALGPTRDVTLIDATLEGVVPTDGPEGDRLGAIYVAGSDWDPRAAGPDYVFLILRPTTVQAWREVDELKGRTLMRDGVWLD